MAWDGNKPFKPVHIAVAMECPILSQFVKMMTKIHSTWLPTASDMALLQPGNAAPNMASKVSACLAHIFGNHVARLQRSHIGSRCKPL